MAMFKEPWALLGFGLTLTYNGKRGRQNKLVNYLLYPVHMLVPAASACVTALAG